MNETFQSITLSEWETREPTGDVVLAGRFLDDSAAARSAAEILTKSRRLELTELRTGLKVRSCSYVGRVQLGGLSVTVLPKLRGSSMLGLLRYAYGFRQLKLITDTSHFNEPCGFEDLLIHQLNAEAQELLSRGLQCAYTARHEALESPRGRIDVQQLARLGGSVTATLPCRHYRRIEDTLLNRVLVSGLKLAGTIASHVELRRESMGLAGLIEEQVSSINLNAAVMALVEQQLTRLSKAYGPAITIIRSLLESQGVALRGETLRHRLPGYLFDMNAFFQALLTRFLRENLPTYSVIGEHSLTGMMRYNPNFSPQRKPPLPRPDYVIKQGNKVCSILDAKYRDIWVNELPGHMLYQLVVYAVSCRDKPHSTILYPSFHPGARLTCIEVMDPVHADKIGEVRMCPINLRELEILVNDSTEPGRRQREKYALSLAQLEA